MLEIVRSGAGLRPVAQLLSLHCWVGPAPRLGANYLDVLCVLVLSSVAEGGEASSSQNPYESKETRNAKGLHTGSA